MFARQGEVGEVVSVVVVDRKTQGRLAKLDTTGIQPKGEIAIEGYSKPVECGFHPESGWYSLKD